MPGFIRNSDSGEISPSMRATKLQLRLIIFDSTENLKNETDKHIKYQLLRDKRIFLMQF